MRKRIGSALRESALILQSSSTPGSGSRAKPTCWADHRRDGTTMRLVPSTNPDPAVKRKNLVPSEFRTRGSMPISRAGRLPPRSARRGGEAARQRSGDARDCPSRPIDPPSARAARTGRPGQSYLTMAKERLPDVCERGRPREIRSSKPAVSGPDRRRERRRYPCAR